MKGSAITLQSLGLVPKGMLKPVGAGDLGLAPNLLSRIGCRYHLLFAKRDEGI